MAKNELKFQKELVKSAVAQQYLAEIISHRWKKGWPDVMIKSKPLPSVFIECKHELKRLTNDFIPIGTTELQKLCLKKMQRFSMLAFILIKVTIDKKQERVYPVYNMDAEVIDISNSAHYLPTGREKGFNLWPVTGIINDAIAALA